MTPPTTQLTLLPVHPDTTIEDPSSQAGESWNSILETIAAQPGHEHTYWGRRVEDPSIVHLYVDWTSTAAHQTFLASTAYPHFSATLSTLLTAPATTHHANLLPHPLTAIFSKSTSPVTELAIFYFPSPLLPTNQSAFDSTIDALSAGAVANAEGLIAIAGGWVVEELHHAEIGTARAYLGAIGWTSVEAHMRYRDTEYFKEKIVELREKVGAVEMHHVVFENTLRGQGTLDPGSFASG